MTKAKADSRLLMNARQLSRNRLASDTELSMSVISDDDAAIYIQRFHGSTLQTFRLTLGEAVALRHAIQDALNAPGSVFTVETRCDVPAARSAQDIVDLEIIEARRKRR